MKQGILKTYDLDPDGVRIVVKWEDMVAGASVFIPCINTEEAMRQAAKVLVEKDYKTEARVVIENEILGIRIWRTT
jgi:phosphoribosylamine-glycine ligase|tara:strand:+ start:1151 stop:1378 length:228 start_codon:yes stop_codon:yes gene_type:complete